MVVEAFDVRQRATGDGLVRGKDAGEKQGEKQGEAKKALTNLGSYTGSVAGSSGFEVAMLGTGRSLYGG